MDHHTKLKLTEAVATFSQAIERQSRVLELLTQLVVHGAGTGNVGAGPREHLRDANEVQRITGQFEALAVDHKGIEALLGGIRVSATTRWRWEKAGLIDRVPGVKKPVYTVESVKRFADSGRRINPR